MLLAYSSDISEESTGRTTFLVTFLDLIGGFFDELNDLSSISEEFSPLSLVEG